MPTYKSPFKAEKPEDEWLQAAWGHKRTRIEMKFDPSLKYYSAAISPLFAHSAVAGASTEVKDQLLVLSLHTYLEFTVRLEMGPVNEVAGKITEPAFLPWLPHSLKIDAYKVYYDESFHAEESHRLQEAVSEATGIQPIILRPVFLDKLDQLVAAAEYEVRPLIKLFFVIISETLITGSLAQVPHDKTVQPPVREVTLMHARDEQRHHQYFKTIFELVWPRLPHRMQRIIGTRLPDMIRAFLEPDANAIREMLERVALPIPAAQVAQQICRDRTTDDLIKKAAEPTMKILKGGNVLSDSQIVTAFANRALI